MICDRLWWCVGHQYMTMLASGWRIVTALTWNIKETYCTLCYFPLFLQVNIVESMCPIISEADPLINYKSRESLASIHPVAQLDYTFFKVGS